MTTQPQRTCWCFEPAQAAGPGGPRLIDSENHGFAEQTPVWFLEPGPGDWQLLIDDEPLPLIDSLSGSGPGIGPAWQWTPGFFAGEVTAELLDPSGRVARRFLLDVAPDPGKLGRDAFAAMLNEVWAWDPALVLGQEPATRAVGSQGNRQARLVELARLRRHTPAALRALRQVAERPIQRLQARRRRLPLGRVRRIDRLSVAALTHQPELAGWLLDDDPPGTIDERAIDPEALIDTPGAEPDLDCAPNRAITAAAMGLVARLRSVQRELQGLVDSEQQSETRSALATRWPVRRRFLQAHTRALQALLRGHPFAAVTRPEISAAGLTAIAAHPAYAGAYRHAWLARRPGVEGPPTDERLWISPTWEVYERWCFVRLSQALSAGDATPWKTLHRVDCPADAALHRALPDGSTQTLLLQPRFPAWDRSRPGAAFRSLSGQRIPDIVLTLEGCERGDDNGRCWLVFDAKYRASRENLLDAMASAHIYHDALRWRGLPPHRVLLLAPASRGVDWLRGPAFHHEHGIGLIEAGIETDWTWLGELIRSGHEAPAW